MKSGTILLLLAGLALAQGVIQQIELYSELNQGGSSITLRDKVPDLKDWKFFLGNVKSHCVTGVFFFFTEANFYGARTGFFGNGVWGTGNEGRKCVNGSGFSRFNSVRYWGPADTRAIGISIYEGTTSNYIGGTEVVVEGRAATNFPMNKTVWVVSHGK